MATTEPGPNRPPATKQPHRLHLLTKEDVTGDPQATHKAVAEARTDGYDIFSWIKDVQTGDLQLYAEIKRAPKEMPESFAHEPLTVGERRAENSPNASSWSPRDLLVKLLRDHDAGKAVLDDIVVVWRSGDEFGFWNASKLTTTALGLLAGASHDIAAQSRV